MPCIGVTGKVSEPKVFEWDIPDFLTLSVANGSFHSSPSFVFDNTSFHLDIYPEGDDCTGSISLYLVNESNSPVDVAYEFHIKKADGTLAKSRSDEGTLEPSVGDGLWHYCDRSYLLENNTELVPSDTLTIVCVLKFVKGGKEVPVKSDNVKILHEENTQETLDYERLTDLDTLSENLKDLSAYKESCDVTLQVEDKEFKAHKAILMARSPVLAAMFKHDTLEKKTGFINVQDCDSESFQEFLDFLYSGKLEDVSFQSAFHLYSTSHKYEVLKLQEFCAKYLMKSLTLDNICAVFELADKYDEATLITKTQDFFNKNMCRIIPTAEWQRLIISNPRLANKLLLEYSKANGSQ